MACSVPASKYVLVKKPAEALKCPICQDVAEDPRQHGNCGKLFCKKCLYEYGKKRPCLNCRAEQPQYFEDNKSKV